MRSPSLLAILSLTLLARGAWAQSLGVTEDEVGVRKHRDFAGKPCLVSEPVSRSLKSNPRIFYHAVRFDNHCIDQIKVKVCYYHSDECRDVLVPGHGSQEQVIGVFPAMQMFRYEVKEQF